MITLIISLNLPFVQKWGFVLLAKDLPAEHKMTSGLGINQCVYETCVHTHVHMRAFRKQFLLLT